MSQKVSSFLTNKALWISLEFVSVKSVGIDQHLEARLVKSLWIGEVNFIEVLTNTDYFNELN